jgi:uncharacterized membrane protein
MKTELTQLIHGNVKKLSELKQSALPVRNVNIERKEKLSVTDKIALWVINRVGTWQFAVFCILLTVTPILVPATMQVVMFISSSFLQLVLLPLIMIGQNLQSAHSEARAEADFEVNTKAENEIRTILQHLENQNDIMLKILNKIETKN